VHLSNFNHQSLAKTSKILAPSQQDTGQNTERFLFSRWRFPGGGPVLQLTVEGGYFDFAAHQ
jgi:hypothetical protein